MSDSLFSQSWYRVADLKPRLRSHAQVHRHYYRGALWYVLQDHSAGRFNRFSPQAYLIIQLMNGVRTMEEIWRIACAKLGDDMASQDEIIALLGQLHNVDVLQTDKMPDITAIHERYKKQKRNKILQYIKSPLAMRLPLIDPERFIGATAPWVTPLLTKFGFIVWSVLIVYGFMQAATHWQSLTNNFSDRLFDAGNFVLLWFVYPFVKLFHELGHAYMIKRFNGEVHEMGFMFLVFIPIPYVDASAASALRSKYQRMLVGAAGIMVELLLAAMGVIVWVQMEPGLARAMIFNMILIGSVSTLLFNGNPLLRFDAYYVLSDFLEIPNLGNKSNAYVGYWLQRYLLRIEDAESPANSVTEAVWLGTYSIASFTYRLIIMVGIALFVASKFFIVGVLLAIWSMFNTIILPLLKTVNQIRSSALLTRYRMKLMIYTGGAFVGLCLFAFALPLPLMSVTQGVIWAPEDSQVNVNENCFVTEVVVPQKSEVVKGQILIHCESLEISALVARTRGKLMELIARQRATLEQDLTEYRIITDEISRTREELDIMLTRQRGLDVPAKVAGIVNLYSPEDLVGRFFAKGTYLGYIDQGLNTRVRTVVHQDDIAWVVNDLQKVDVKLSESVSATLPALVRQETPAASKNLPSMALSVEGGGEIVLDPEERAPGSVRALNTYFVVDLDLLEKHSERVGERVYVRFHHSPEPIAYRIYRAVRRLFLRRFAV